MAKLFIHTHECAVTSICVKLNKYLFFRNRKYILILLRERTDLARATWNYIWKYFRSINNILKENLFSVSFIRRKTYCDFEFRSSFYFCTSTFHYSLNSLHQLRWQSYMTSVKTKYKSKSNAWSNKNFRLVVRTAFRLSKINSTSSKLTTRSMDADGNFIARLFDAWRISVATHMSAAAVRNSRRFLLCFDSYFQDREISVWFIYTIATVRA